MKSVLFFVISLFFISLIILTPKTHAVGLSLLSPWLAQDIGEVSAPGTALINNGVFNLSGAGDDIWNRGDEFFYVYQPLSGDGEIITQVVSIQKTDPWAKAGIMIRENLTAGSRNVALLVSPSNGLTFQQRAEAAEISNYNSVVGTAPIWLKLKRIDDSFVAYTSNDGISWSQAGSLILTLNTNVYIGLVVTSHRDGLLTDAIFDHVNVAGQQSINQSLLPVSTFTASPVTIIVGQSTTLSWDAINATAVNIDHGIGTVAVSGTRSISPKLSTTYTLRATNGAGSASQVVTINVKTTSDNNKNRANSYDDAWQDGSNGWVANAKSILAGSNKIQGFLLHLGDSLTRDYSYGAWARAGNGKTVEDKMITQWLHASPAPATINSYDGFALATEYHCPSRSRTVGDGRGTWDFLGTSMPADTNSVTAKQKLEDCASYPSSLNITTIVSAFPDAQFAIPLFNLYYENPSNVTDLKKILDVLISKKIVPILSTYTYRISGNPSFNPAVDVYNNAIKNLAKEMKLPLIDLNAEMLARRPFSEWGGTFLSGDGVHYAVNAGGFGGGSDPYQYGGDPSTHTTGEALRNNGYVLRGWLAVQKMKEIKQLVIDSNSTTFLKGDLNNDKIVNSLDWSIMNSRWFTNDTTVDLNSDGIVNSLDFSILNSNWLKTV
ncbi:MAG: hypothetical protein A3C70_00020 [Candidatus Zambryskibacteria bacterium RIFCSPHIGHO2_02_FULL_43_14]|uniref:Dockerin domain-containing protein n=1 Tax=Candidatus Zambryskibacteria bacterium RIFCSPHIGHO2_02_FULL_43_14 TaxID=1802748 RepID=A0A1G2TFK7_9BACT|nr:MAG: hypothetical protein A2829_03070 [Candidatus Zambryskibacteria bacterium RIFCSPHIGHO2_01_FULL_43_60]OHA95838.1 MAG: hypothetical protein A3C70_00020 [Candidatus Zambryskibacteria bacterium RIFCSPHIGHO2_02_FULL_43_14]OHB03374.1 MAG: hypothetical protein A3B03_02200 [Candidatus Zambryskibacteria bacterium RIFCSPLOWO2_01_FULL_42_41]